MKMVTVNITGALWYIAETAIPEPTRIRVYHFGYNAQTVCQIEGGGIISCENAILSAKSGEAVVYVPLDTVKKNHVYEADNTAFNTALTMMISAGICMAILGKP